MWSLSKVVTFVAGACALGISIYNSFSFTVPFYWIGILFAITLGALILPRLPWGTHRV